MTTFDATHAATTGAMPATVPVAHEVVGQGPPVLLLAGTGYAGSTWPSSFVGPLAERFSVITFDYRGTGRTPGTPEPYSTRLFAADAAELVRTLGLGPAHVVGHSMGGRVAQWLAIDHPDTMRRLVLAASGPGPIRRDLPHLTGIPPSVCLALVEKGYHGYIDGQIRSTFFTPEFRESDPATVDALVDAFWENRGGLADYLSHVIARQGHDTVDRLSEITQPTLVLVGERDTHAGGTGSHVEQSRYLAEHLPNATFQLVPDAAHGYFWQCPTTVVPLIADFLRSVS